jgi:hypothetical protein
VSDVRLIYIEEFITALRESDRHIEAIFTKGGCYRFVKLLQRLSPNVTPMISAAGDHAAAEFDGKLYDITGEITGDFREPTLEDLIKMDSWSFDRHHMLAVGECPNCDEPIGYVDDVSGRTAIVELRGDVAVQFGDDVYTHPPAQPKVPEPLPMEPFATIDKDSKNYRAGWNACRRAMLTASQEQQVPTHV